MIITRARGRRKSMSGTDATATPRRSARNMSGPSQGSLSTGYGQTRKAQPRGKARVATKLTNPFITDGESEHGEADSGDGDNGAEEDDAAVTKAWKIQYEVITSLLPDLRRATRDLKQRIDNGSDGQEVLFAAILKAKRDMFHSLIKALNYPASQSPFIDFLSLERFAKKGRDSVIRALLAANLVYVLDRIQQIVNGDPVDVLSFIKGLDEAFPHLLAASGGNTSPSLALEIRTQVFIQTLAAQSGEPDVAAAIASVLCASDDSKDNGNHDASPNDIMGMFESLFDTGETEEEIQDITHRTRQLAAILCKDKESEGLRALEKDCPLKSLLQEVHTWCGEQFRLVQEAEEENFFQDAWGPLPSMIDTPIRLSIVRRSPDFHK
ncbi:hypothetical protein E4U09_004603 [Claviceps aff. purpurea]|uniref:Uncharacterized protein n=1 Tax=Claviceps aff. purpurea TaxID=1967640 RepID=A0A9P7QCY3_9HYPO|nr:hypothetical protein E4U09_004603 [Claviceps aff. purpurea]